MALFTPRGLKVVLPQAYAFALMARVYPKTDAFRVLQLTEEVENLPKLATLIAGVIAFALRLEPVQIGLVVFASLCVFKLVHLLGLFVPPFTLLLPVSRLYSFATGYGLLLATLLIFGLVTSGWYGVLAFFAARLACTLLFGVIELAYMKIVFRKVGLAITGSERSFFHAYRLEANRLGASTDLSVTDAELSPTNWEAVYQDLAAKWPMVVNRFTDDHA